jgi:ubiquitin-conjugating enzyme E2 Q
MAACLQKLKSDLRQLQELFPPNSSRFQIILSSVDELNCRFVGPQGEKYAITANILENYPESPPVWFSESENATVANTLSLLSDTSGIDNLIIPQVYALVKNLCQAFNVSVPAQLSKLKPPVASSQSRDEDNTSDLDVESDGSDGFYDMEEDTTAAASSKESHSEYAGLDAASVSRLEKLKHIQQQEHLRGTISGSVQATDRLMKELRDIYKSDSYKRGVYTIDLLNDSNLYEWHIQLKKVDPDSALYQDMITLKKKENQDHILLHFIFKVMV